MASQLSTTNSVKQHTRQFMSVASDKIKLASASVARGETRVCVVPERPKRDMRTVRMYGISSLRTS